MPPCPIRPTIRYRSTRTAPGRKSRSRPEGVNPDNPEARGVTTWAVARGSSVCSIGDCVGSSGSASFTPQDGQKLDSILTARQQDRHVTSRMVSVTAVFGYLSRDGQCFVDRHRSAGKCRTCGETNWSAINPYAEGSASRPLGRERLCSQRAEARSPIPTRVSAQ